MSAGPFQSESCLLFSWVMLFAGKNAPTKRRRRVAPGNYGFEPLEQRSLLVAPVDFEWAQAVSPAAANEIDAAGNLYSVGSFSGTVDFDPGAGVASLTSAGGTDVFVTKTDAAGNLVWAKSFGGSLDDLASGLGVDGEGSVFVGGTYSGTIDLDPSSGVASQTSAGSSDVFILKLDANGHRLWSGSMGGSAADTGGRIDMLFNGDLVLRTISGGTMDFDPGPGASTQTAAGSYEVLLSASGQLARAQLHTTPAAVIDTFGNRYVLQSQNSGFSVPGASVSGRFASIRKTNPDGSELWTRRIPVYPIDSFGSTRPAVIESVTLAHAPGGGIAISMQFWGDLKADASRPGLRNSDGAPVGPSGFTTYLDNALLQLDVDGNPTSIAGFDSNGRLNLSFAQTTRDDSLHVTAELNQGANSDGLMAVDLDPGSGVYSPGLGTFDLRFNEQGQVESFTRVPNTSSATLRLYDDRNGTAYFLSPTTITGVVDADPGPGISLVNVGAGLRLLTKMSAVMTVSAPAGQQGDLILRRNGDWLEAHFRSSTSSIYQLQDRNLLKDLRAFEFLIPTRETQSRSTSKRGYVCFTGRHPRWRQHGSRCDPRYWRGNRRLDLYSGREQHRSFESLRAGYLVHRH